jgi:hypothetical protein
MRDGVFQQKKLIMIDNNDLFKFGIVKYVVINFKNVFLLLI